MRKAIFWGFLGTLAEPGAPSPNPLDPGQYRVYPDAAATLALCAYKGYQNYMLAEGFPRLTELLPKLHLERFFPGRVVSGRVELAGNHGEGLYPVSRHDLAGQRRFPGAGRRQGRGLAHHPGLREGRGCGLCLPHLDGCVASVVMEKG